VLGQRVQGDVSLRFEHFLLENLLEKKLNVLNTVEPVYNGRPWDSKKWPLFLGGRYLEGSHQRL
jgi:hypothetical protein